ncbi:MAG: 50S ribosomal protein L24e [Candidatus Woesearchaeota archaeon]
MVKCSFCGNTLSKGTGKMYIKTDARVLYFCSNKCEKNMLKLNRKARNLKWTKEYTKSKKSEKSE